MARLVFPDEGSRLVYRSAGRGKAMTNASGSTVEVYADAAGTQVADIQSTLGAAVSGAVLSVDSHSLIPLFLGPDGVDTLYVVVDGGPVSVVYARTDDRLDSLGSSVSSNITALATKAPLASPALTGSPTVNGTAVETTTGAQTKATAAQAAATTAAATDASTKAAAAQAAATTAAATDASAKATAAQAAAIAGAPVQAVAGLTGSPTAAQLETAGLLRSSTASATYVASEAVDVTVPWTSTVATRTGGTANDYTCIGVDPVTGAAWFKSSGLARIVQCDDPSATTPAFSGARTLPSNVTAANVSSIRRVGSTVILHGKETSGNTLGVWTAPAVAQAGDWTWSAQQFTFRTGATAWGLSLETSAWGAGDIAVLCEYGDPSGGPRIAVSTDAGATWTVTYSPAIRHVHHVKPDPYNPGHVWATLGDGTALTVIRSTDYGQTWAVVVASSSWQAVQISFTSKYVFLAADSHNGTAFIIDRTSGNIRHLTTNYHHFTPPPYGASAGRVVTDLVTTSGSGTVTSATAAFTSADVGRYVEAVNQLAPRTFIIAVGSATSVTVSPLAFATTAGTTGRISGDMYFANAFYGAVDPATGIYYCVPCDTSDAGTMQGLFAVARPGGRAEILDPGNINASLIAPVYLAGGKVFYGIRSRKLLSKTAVAP